MLRDQVASIPSASVIRLSSMRIGAWQRLAQLGSASPALQQMMFMRSRPQPSTACVSLKLQTSHTAQGCSSARHASSSPRMCKPGKSRSLELPARQARSMYKEAGDQKGEVEAWAACVAPRAAARVVRVALTHHRVVGGSDTPHHTTPHHTTPHHTTPHHTTPRFASVLFTSI